MRWLWVLAVVASCDYVFRLDHVPDPPAPDAAPVIVHRWAQVSAGLGHTCALDTSGGLFCWGRNANGETGTQSMDIQVDAPTRVGGEATWTSVATRYSTTCGIQTGGSLWCWGRNDDGQVGDGALSQRILPQKVSDGPWRSVATHAHTCAVRDDDRSLWCWGNNELGQLGDGTMANRSSPYNVVPAMQWSSVSVGSDTTCAIDSAAKLWCWGNNSNGQFGVTAPLKADSPQMTSAASWASISLADNSACGITQGGELMCWGNNGIGQLGDGTLDSRPAPERVTVPGSRTDWVDVVTSGAGACARAEDSAIFCWGESTRRQLGVEQDAVLIPVPLHAGRSWNRVAMGGGHTCLIESNETMWCFGDDGWGQLGDGGTSPTTPVEVPGSWTAVAPGLSHTCAIDVAGAVHCAGSNGGSQLGTNTRARDAMTPNGLTAATDIGAGQDHTCAIKAGQVWCWGANYLGQLGTGNTNYLVQPGQIRSGSTVRANQTTCTIDPTTARIWCWGYNAGGQVNGSPNEDVPELSPVEVSTQAWTLLAVGRRHVCGVVAANAEAYCWGPAPYVGDGSSSGSPLFVGPANPVSTGLTNVAQISGGSFHTCAVLANGQGSCWGAGYTGQLGTGSTSHQSTPTAVMGEWAMIGAGFLHSCGVRTDGSLWCWGSNTRGQLGIGSRSSSPNPTPSQVGTDTDWVSTASYESQSCAFKTGNRLFCWGNNSDGQIGTGAAWRSELVQVP